MKEHKIHFETLGCRLNQIESESAARFFSDAGFSVSMEGLSAKTEEDFDVILCIINTCTVTSKAEQKARRIIRLILKKYPEATVVITGCYAQVEPQELLAINEKIAVLPGQNKGRLADLPVQVKNFLENSEWNSENFAKFLQTTIFKIESSEDTEKSVNSEKVENFEKKSKLLENSTENLKKVEKLKSAKFVPVKIGTAEDPFRLSTDTFLSHSRSSLKIQDGCNCQCTYCRIHIARGKSVSLDAAEVLRRVQELKNAGQKEVVITTVNIAQYASVFEGRKINFTGLLEILLQKTSEINFRLSSLYPELVDEKFAELIKDERVCPHFHLSIQSGSDRILKLMKRPYLVEKVYKAIELLKSAKKNPFIACDLITGFPGETAEDFEETMKLCRWACFTWIHAFPFSARPETEAYFMKPKIPESVAGERVGQLLDLAVQNKINYIEDFVGKTIKAIAEKSLQNDSTKIRAVTENFLHCVVDCGKNKIPPQGSEILVKIRNPLEEKIKLGDEVEAVAELIS